MVALIFAGVVCGRYQMPTAPINDDVIRPVLSILRGQEPTALEVRKLESYFGFVMVVAKDRFVHAGNRPTGKYPSFIKLDTIGQQNSAIAKAKVHFKNVFKEQVVWVERNPLSAKIFCQERIDGAQAIGNYFSVTVDFASGCISNIQCFGAFRPRKGSVAPTTQSVRNLIIQDGVEFELVSYKRVWRTASGPREVFKEGATDKELVCLLECTVKRNSVETVYRFGHSGGRAVLLQKFSKQKKSGRKSEIDKDLSAPGIDF